MQMIVDPPVTYPPRIQALRSAMIKDIPKVPNNKQTAAHLAKMSTNKLILVFLTWRMRLVSAKPREIKIWSGGIQPQAFTAIKPELEPLLKKVALGADLTPHLSSLVNTLGFAMPGVASPEQKRNEQDHVLTKTGLHHFHVGTATARNPKGRSGRLMFADVSDTEFKIIAISDHDAFQIGSGEWQRLFGISNKYIQSQLPEGTTGYMAYPVMASGHDMLLVTFADHCEDRLQNMDHIFDDPTALGELIDQIKATNSDLTIMIPRNPKFRWGFNAENNFGFYESKSRYFFRVLFCPRST